MKINLINLILVILFCGNSLVSQQVIQIQSTFTGDTLIQPFNQSQIYGCQVTGIVTLNSDTSFVRLYLLDQSNVEYILHESYPMICDDRNSFTNDSYETEYISLNPSGIYISISDASINLTSLTIDTTYNNNYDSLQAIYKDNVDSIKVNSINAYLEENKIPWRAAQSEFSDKPYRSKKNMLGNAMEIGYLQTIEYYAGGFFPIGDDYNNPADPVVVEEFDWRNRHGANNPNSPYYDNDPNGSGWITPRYTAQVCNDCWAFSPVYSVESDINLYFNQHLDEDLSEQHIVSCVGDEDCQSGGYQTLAESYILNNGIVLENCFPHDPQNGVGCDELCIDPDDIYTPDNKISITNSDPDDIKENLINHGLGATIMYIWSHTMSMVGFGKVSVGDIIQDGENSFTGEEITVQPGSELIDCEYWIFKQSWGSWGANGTPYIYVVANPDYLDRVTYFTGEITSLVYDSTDVECLDEDGDGYYYWGIGDKPAHCDSCPDVQDCDDSNPFYTYYDSSYDCYVDCSSISYDTVPLTITSSTVLLPGPYNSDIVINNGAVLEINDKVLFQEDCKIIVKPGAQLIINGGILTNACDSMWHGVQVQGSPTSGQNLASQGYVEIKNGAIIENSIYGVYADKMEKNQSGQWISVSGYEGGIIQAKGNSKFLNNKTAAQLYDYSTTSVSYLIDCEFKIDDDYIGPDDPENYVLINDMISVDIENCDFINETSTDHQYCGVKVENASVNIEGDFTDPNWDNGKFENLEYGVYATALYTTRKVDIRHTDFLNNKRGIYISGMTAPRVTSNDFKLDVGYSAIGNNSGYGLYLDESTDYWVEDNVFDKCETCSSETGVGIIVNESGRDPNEIYLNEFNYMEYAINVQGENRNNNKSLDGLVIKCNDYNNTLFDETILFDDLLISPYDGISGYQGSNTTNIEDMAGNVFYYETSDDDYDDINNEANHFYYYYSSNASGYTVDPADFTTSTVTKTAKPTGTWTYSTACEPQITSGGGSGLKSSGLEEDLAFYIQEITDIETTLQNLIDGGDTEGLNEEVETSTPPEAVVLYYELLSESPYLSETVVESTIEKEDVLPNAMVRDVMVANPHSSACLQLMDKLDKRNTPMPEYMKAQILAGRSLSTIKQELESKLASYYLKKQKTINNLVRQYMIDNEDPTGTNNDVISLFQSDNSLKSKYKLAWIYLDKGMATTGEGILNGIPSQFELNTVEQQNHTKLCTIYGLLKALSDNGLTIESISEDQITQLQGIASGEQGMSRAYARNILLSIGELVYDEPILQPDFEKSASETEAYNELLVTKAPKMLSLYPNPSTGYIVLEFNLDMEEESQIEISDVTGKIIYTAENNVKRNQITVLTDKWQTGIYVATLKINGQSVESVKFSLVK